MAYTETVSISRRKRGATAPKPEAERQSQMGRPRAEDRTPAILEAAKELLGEVGYDRLRIQDVADRAGAGLATLYRRWPTKQALVGDAIRHHSDAFLPPRLEDPKADLVEVYRALTEKLCGDGGEVLSGFLAALRTEPELASVLRDVVLEPMRVRARADIASIVGEENPHLDLLVDLGPGLLLFRTVMLGETSTSDEFLASVLELITAIG
jgi:AcrR family transcriptional regulator